MINLQNKFNIYLLISFILLSVTLMSPSLAAEPDEKNNFVEFGLIGDSSENKVPVPISNASNIGTPKTFTGQVALTNFPKLEFDTQKISGHDEKIKAKSKEETISGFRVDDVSGNGNGWQLRVKASEFVRQDDKKTELKGAKLEFPRVKPITYATSLNKEKEPVVNKTSIGFDEVIHSLMMATEGSGMGAWEIAYDDGDEINLHLPSGQLLGVYETTITYQLTVDTIIKDTAK